MKYSLLPFLFVFTLFVACQQESIELEPSTVESPTVVSRTNSAMTIGYDFTNIPHWLELHVDGEYRPNFKFINKTHNVEALNSSTVSAKHWSFKSPSLDGHSVGFSIIKEAICETTPCDVVLYLHGNTGSEGAGVSLYNNYASRYKSGSPGKVFIFANGISRGTEIGRSWKPEAFDANTYLDPQVLIKELIGGLVADEDNQFGYMKKDMASWSVIGFSAGSNAAVGLYLNPLFYNAPNHQPQTILSMAGWMSNHQDYFPFSTSQLNGCSNTPVKYLVALHDQDDVNCTGNTVYSQASDIIDPLNARDLPYTYLGLSRDVANCSPPNSNPSHTPSFYLNHVIDNPNHVIDQEFNCHNGGFLSNFQSVGNVLYDH